MSSTDWEKDLLSVHFMFAAGCLISTMSAKDIERPFHPRGDSPSISDRCHYCLCNPRVCTTVSMIEAQMFLCIVFYLSMSWASTLCNFICVLFSF